MFLRTLACTLLAGSTTLAVPTLGRAQMADSSKPLASPAATANVALGDAKITVAYNAPSVRGRKIVGGLVPYGKVWRTGANPATTLTTSSDLHFGKLLVPAGTHTIYTYPGEKQWLLILNKQTGQWGTIYDKAQDLGRVDMTMSTPPIMAENLKYTFSEVGGKHLLTLCWENLCASVVVAAE